MSSLQIVAENIDTECPLHFEDEIKFLRVGIGLPFFDGKGVEVGEKVPLTLIF